MRTLNPDDFLGYLAKTEHIAKIKTADVFEHQFLESFENPKALTGDKLPFESSHNKFRFRAGEVTLWSGFNGHGKSMILGQAMLNTITNEARGVCIASLEMQPWDTLNRMARQFFAHGKPLPEELREFLQVVKHHCYLYDHIGTVRSAELLDAVAYCGHELKLSHFVIDSLMKTEIPEDDMHGQKNFVSNLCAIAKDTGLHIHLVAHSRKNKDEDTPPSKMDVRGSGALTDQVDNVLSMWQCKTENARKQFPNMDAMLICSKQRHGGWEGSIPLRFDKHTLCFQDAFGHTEF